MTVIVCVVFMVVGNSSFCQVSAAKVGNNKIRDKNNILWLVIDISVKKCNTNFFNII
jgi:hypothetical protein